MIWGGGWGGVTVCGGQGGGEREQKQCMIQFYCSGFSRTLSKSTICKGKHVFSAKEPRVLSK